MQCKTCGCLYEIVTPQEGFRSMSYVKHNKFNRKCKCSKKLKHCCCYEGAISLSDFRPKGIQTSRLREVVPPIGA